jgi:hypothetical protein
VRVSAEHLLEPLVSHLPAGWKPESSRTVERLYSVIRGSVSPRPSVRPFSFLYADAQQLARTLHTEDLYDALEADIDFYLAQAARQRLFVHAGVVAWKGQAIVIPGRSRCFGRNKRRADWIACVIGLANRLLGAELRDVPVEYRANSLPRWLISSVLKQWSTPYPPNLPSFASQLKGSWWRAEISRAESCPVEHSAAILGRSSTGR